MPAFVTFWLYALYFCIFTCRARDLHIVRRTNDRRYHRPSIPSPNTCIIILSKNEWPLIRSSVLHHGDLVGFNMVHVIDNSDDPVAIDFLEKMASQRGVHVTFSAQGFDRFEDEIAAAMLSMRHFCDFFFKLDTDEFLGLYSHEARTVLFDKQSFQHSMESLPIDGHKYEIMRRAPVVHQLTCEDPALAITFHPYQVGHMGKHFFYSKSLLKIDLGTHVGQIDPVLNQTHTHPTNVAILHFQNKCYDTYIRNLKETLASQGVFSLTSSFEEQKRAVEQLKDKFANRCGMINCHKVKIMHAYFNDTAAFAENYRKQAQATVPGAITITGLRDKLLLLMLQEGTPV